MASSAEIRDILRHFDEDARFVGCAQEARDLLQQLDVRFRGLQGRMFLEFCLNRRDVIAVMPTAGAFAPSCCQMHVRNAVAAHGGRLDAPGIPCRDQLQVAKASL